MTKRVNMLAIMLFAVLLTVFFCMPNQVLAVEDYRKPKATNIHYYPSDDAAVKDRTGIKSFKLDPYVYYNLSKDETVNPDGKDTINIDSKTLLDITKSQIFPRWSVIASEIFRNQADQLVTIKGSGMMSSSTTSSDSFDRHFNTNKSGISGYSNKWAIGDLASELSRSGVHKVGSELKDELRTEGISTIANLADARKMMGQSLRNCSDDNDNTVDDFLGNKYDKTDDKYRLPDLQDTTTGNGFCNVVTCINQKAVNDYDYVTFGIAVYDFDVTPVAASDLAYIEAAQKLDNGADILMGKKGDQDVNGVKFSESRTDGETSYFKNATAHEATQSAGLETSITEESAVSQDDTYE